MVPITGINTSAKWDAITLIDKDGIPFKQGNTDWSINICFEKDGANFAPESVTMALFRYDEVIGEITSEYYTYVNGVVTIPGAKVFVSDPGVYNIYINDECNISYAIRYEVISGVTCDDTFNPLPDFDTTIYGDEVPLDHERTQTVTSAIDELDNRVTTIEENGGSGGEPEFETFLAGQYVTDQDAQNLLITTNSNNIINLNGNIETINTTLTTIGSNITDIQTDITNISEEQITQNLQIENLQTADSTINENLDGLDTRVSTLETNYTSVEDDIIAIKSEQTTQNSAITDLQTEDIAINNSISTLDARVDTLETTVTDIQATDDNQNNRLDALESQTVSSGNTTVRLFNNNTELYIEHTFPQSEITAHPFPIKIIIDYQLPTQREYVLVASEDTQDSLIINGYETYIDIDDVTGAMTIGAVPSGSLKNNRSTIAVGTNTIDGSQSIVNTDGSVLVKCTLRGYNLDQLDLSKIKIKAGPWANIVENAQVTTLTPSSYTLSNNSATPTVLATINGVLPKPSESEYMATGTVTRTGGGTSAGYLYLLLVDNTSGNEITQGKFKVDRDIDILKQFSTALPVFLNETIDVSLKAYYVPANTETITITNPILRGIFIY